MSHTQPMVASRSAALASARRQFFATLLRSLLPSDYPLNYGGLVPWFEYIEEQFSGSSRAFHIAWLNYLDISTPSDPVAWYGFLKDMVGVVRRYPDEKLITIDGIAEAIVVLHSQPWPPESPAAARHSILSAIGCLTMLYDSGMPMRLDVLTVNVPCSNSLKPRAQNAEDAAQRAVVRLLAGFELLPVIRSTDDLLFGSYLNFFTLSVVGKIKVDFVHHVSSHLVFNPGSKRLSVFAHPAFSAMYLDPAFNTDFQERLLRDFVPSDDYENMRHFHQEILLSYRFLFGSDRKSHDRFVRCQRGQIDNPFWKRLLVKQTIWTRLWMPTHQESTSGLPEAYWSEAVKDSDGNLAEQENYDAGSDFLFLGPRLLQLQRYCSRQNPNRWSEIFWDQRHKQQWITLWAAIMIGGASVFLSLVQVILAGFAAAGQTAAPPMLTKP